MKTTKPDSPAQRIIEEELRILGRVSGVLSEMSTQNLGAPDFDQELVNLRDQLAEAKPEDIAAIVEHMTRISSLAQRYGKGRDLPVNPDSPYFAHLRLAENQRVRDVLIGKRALVDRKQQVQIVDWRNAPVSRIYYRYAEGDDYEECFGEQTLNGVVEARRSLTIDQAVLKRISCPQGVYLSDTEGQWQEAEPVSVAQLSGGQGSASRPPALQRGSKDSTLGIHSGKVLRADKHLPEIAALIDHQQFDLITKPESGLVVLQGGAGSGKTTVALHRVAYLNFAKPDRFRVDKMLVVVPSEAMVRYIEGVLPSLGVKKVPVMTVKSWFTRHRRRILPQTSGMYNDDTPAAVLRLKKHPLLLIICREFIKRQLDQANATLQEAMMQCPGGKTVLAEWEKLSGFALIPRLSRLRSWLRQQRLDAVTMQEAGAITRRLSHRAHDVLADWGELLTDRQLLTEATARFAPKQFSAAEIDLICKWCSNQLVEETEDDLEPLEQEKAAAAKHLRSKSEDNDFDDAQPYYMSLDGQDERVSVTAGRFDYPDDSLILYLHWLKYGRLQPHTGKPIVYEHLVIDEAQDLSALEIKVLTACTSELQSITLAGDTAQRLIFDNDFSNWERLLGQIGLSATTHQTLELGYRSTEQIMELARQVMGNAPGFCDLKPQRTGAAVELHSFIDQGEAVAVLAESLRSLAVREPLASVALITRYSEQAKQYAAALQLAEVPRVRHVAKQEFSFQAGIEVTDVTQVKGLEFDYVILLDVDAQHFPDTLESRHLLYIAATRAAHQLWLICSGTPSSIIPAALSEHIR